MLFGVLISVILLIYLFFKFWKKIIKAVFIFLVITFIVAGVKVKEFYNSIIDTTQKNEVLIDTLTNKILK